MFSNLSNLELASLIGLGATLMIFVSNLIANKKIGFFSFVLYLLVLGSYVLKYFFATTFNKLLGSISKIDLYMQIASGAVLLIALLCLFVFTSKRLRFNNLIKYGSIMKGPVIGFISKKHKLVHFNKTIEDILKKQKDQSLELKELYVNGNNLDPKIIKKVLGNNAGKIEEKVRYQLIYQNNLEYDFEFSKIPIKKNKSLLGYILVDDTVTNTFKQSTNEEMKKNMYIYLDLLNLPLAYFEKESFSYVCSSSLIRLLGLETRVIKYDDFKKRIHKDDVAIFNNKEFKKNNSLSVLYRLNTKQGLIWVEESTIIYNDLEYMVIKRVEINNISGLKYLTHRDMINDINARQDFDYGILMVNFKDVEKYVIEKSREFVDALVNKFFTKVNDSYLKDQFTIYKLGAYEFALIINFKEKIDVLVRDFSKGISDLLLQEVIINNAKYKMATDIGVVYAKDFEGKEKRSLIKAAFDVITEVSDPNFSPNYSIYQVVEEKEFNLEDLGINLDEDLEDYE
ncbi:MAG: hypothetical protein WC008_01635 [Bacilli bacterium]